MPPSTPELTPAATGTRARVAGHAILPLDRGWEAASAEPDVNDDPAGLDQLQWLTARVPGTAAGALREAGLWQPSDPADLDSRDWWFRTRFEANPAELGEEVVLRLDGIATVAEVFINRERVLESDSMFVGHTIDVGARLAGENELAIRCRALGPLLRPRRQPRARWRTRIVAEQNLRFLRTMLIGRAPGFAPGPAAVGPWRPAWLERRRGLALDRLRLLPRLAGADGVLEISAGLRAIGAEAPTSVEVELSGPSGTHHGALSVSESGSGVNATGELVVPEVERWFPHTHGEPALHAVRLNVTGAAPTAVVDAGQVGFRSLVVAGDPAEDGLALEVNGVPVFARGAIWTPVDPVGLAPSQAALRATVEAAREAGMNMLRVVGTGAYESAAFHNLCDELGMLVWQDFMFANFDYPIADDAFRSAVELEAAQESAELAGRPSLAVLCGNSEVEQQAAMFGVDPGLGRGEPFATLLPELARDAGCDAAYIPSAPCGGDLPFRTDSGVANYFGVGAYLRPLEDARRAAVRFASECLAFANVPDEDVVAQLLGGSLGGVGHDPRWKRGVPRDAGAGWDFDDVRDHYLELLFDVDREALRSVDPERYLELSRAVSGEVMAEVFGEWRRADSPCSGGLVLWLRDLVAGAGWGLLDHRGKPKVAYHHLRRALAPIAVWTTDEGLGGIGVHVCNERPKSLSAQLRVALYRDLEQRVDEHQQAIELPPGAGAAYDLEALIGRFADASWSYRFGPPAQDLIVASLESNESSAGRPPPQAFRFPAGRPRALESAARLGLEAELADDAGTPVLRVASRRLAYGLRIHAPGFAAADDAFSIEPGHERRVALTPLDGESRLDGCALTALNLSGRLRVTTAEAG